MTPVGSIHVCPLSRLAETAAATGARTLVTLLSPGGVTVARPETIAAENHLLLGLSDITQPTEGLTHASRQHVDDLIAFVRRWDQCAPLLIHCYAGVSRSTAAAFIALCALAPELTETEIARALRQASPTATPNARLVALADDILRRSGRMTAAIAAIGRGVECFEGVPFGLDLRAEADQRPT